MTSTVQVGIDRSLASVSGPRTAIESELIGSLPKVRAFALSLTKDRDRAEDVAQEAVMKAWSRAELFAGGSNLEAWLFTITRNEFLRDVRRRTREVEDVDGAIA